MAELEIEVTEDAWKLIDMNLTRCRDVIEKFFEVLGYYIRLTYLCTSPESMRVSNIIVIDSNLEGESTKGAKHENMNEVYIYIFPYLKELDELTALRYFGMRDIYNFYFERSVFSTILHELCHNSITYYCFNGNIKNKMKVYSEFLNKVDYIDHPEEVMCFSVPKEIAEGRLPASIVYGLLNVELLIFSMLDEAVKGRCDDAMKFYNEAVDGIRNMIDECNRYQDIPPKLNFLAVCDGLKKMGYI